MHNNYYFLRQLSARLKKSLHESVISECFSQNKDELIIRFETHQGSFFLKASITPALTSLSFPSEFHRARKNSIDLFPDMLGHRIMDVVQVENERSFIILLSEEKILLFKMHGNRSNVILFQKDSVIDLFRKNLESDLDLNSATADRIIDWSFDAFVKHQSNPAALYFTFGKLVWRYLESTGFNTRSAKEQWEQILDTKKILEQPPSYFIIEAENKLALSLMEIGEIRKSFHDPVPAINEFFYSFTHSHALHQEKNSVLGQLRTRLSSNKNFITKNADKLREIETDNTYKIWADLVMANMHAIPQNTQKITLENFYDSNKPIEIKLKLDLSPQKNAEVFYRKAKNQQIEIDKLKEAIDAKEKENRKLEIQIGQAHSAEGLKSIRDLKSKVQPEVAEKQTVSLPYHEFLFKGFKIWVGRNAESNDQLTLKYSFKEDLWLHAKDVAGSHVLIKHQAGKPFPKDVIERAAELAAYNSKRKTDSLCPVIVTPKKFVRKRKGDPAGMVVVEREEVVMVVPKLNV